KPLLRQSASHPESSQIPSDQCPPVHTLKGASERLLNHWPYPVDYEQYLTMKASAIVALIVLNIAASQNTAAQTINVRGAGQNSCGNWTMIRSAERTVPNGTIMIAQLEWVLGFVSAFGLARGANIDNGGLFAWIDNYCKQHPLDDLAKATFQL